jgi:hypothetical protein
MTVVKSCGRRTPSKLRFKVRSTAVAKDPDERYSTTEEMAMAVPTESPSERP